MYGEPPTVSNTWAVKAQKQHRCCECDAPIAKGEIYEKVEGLWDGSWQTYKTCWPCVEVRNDLTELMRLMWQHDEAICFGDLQQELADYCAEADRCNAFARERVAA